VVALAKVVAVVACAEAIDDGACNAEVPEELSLDLLQHQLEPQIGKPQIPLGDRKSPLEHPVEKLPEAAEARVLGVVVPTTSSLNATTLKFATDSMSERIGIKPSFQSKQIGISLKAKQRIGDATTTTTSASESAGGLLMFVILMSFLTGFVVIVGVLTDDVTPADPSKSRFKNNARSPNVSLLPPERCTMQAATPSSPRPPTTHSLPSRSLVPAPSSQPSPAAQWHLNQWHRPISAPRESLHSVASGAPSSTKSMQDNPMPALFPTLVLHDSITRLFLPMYDIIGVRSSLEMMQSPEFDIDGPIRQSFFRASVRRTQDGGLALCVSLPWRGPEPCAMLQPLANGSASIMPQVMVNSDYTKLEIIGPDRTMFGILAVQKNGERAFVIHRTMAVYSIQQDISASRLAITASDGATVANMTRLDGHADRLELKIEAGICPLLILSSVLGVLIHV
jgi:hypothetical protein